MSNQLSRIHDLKGSDMHDLEAERVTTFLGFGNRFKKNFLSISPKNREIPEFQTPSGASIESGKCARMRSNRLIPIDNPYDRRDKSYRSLALHVTFDRAPKAWRAVKYLGSSVPNALTIPSISMLTTYFYLSLSLRERMTA